MFELPKYREPDFSEAAYMNMPNARTAFAAADGIAPEGFHSTSMYPEYFKVGGTWRLAAESRMDSCVVLRADGRIDVVEQRNLKKGDSVFLGRSEDGHEGVLTHVNGFAAESAKNKDAFAFRSGRSRETSFSKDYDQLYELLRYEKNHGNVVFVMGPAFAFDADARLAMQKLIENGFVHGLLAGNALATHDLEGAHLGTALGQDIYTQRSVPNGHYHHLDVINRVRRSGSIEGFIRDYKISDGILCALTKHRIPYVLTSSIRDDGPLPEVIADAYEGQKRMRDIIKNATTVIAIATQLHTIAAGNMTPSYRVVNNTVRPLYFYCVDISEFVTNKLHDRGSLSAVTMITNAQDFIVNVARGVGVL